MIPHIEAEVNRRLAAHLLALDSRYSLSSMSPVLSQSLSSLILRGGKRLRPILFVLSHLGYAEKSLPDIYTGALALELLHTFALIHDDIVDNSDFRRSLPTMHRMLQPLLFADPRHSDGKHLAMIAGDILYTTAIHAFVSMDVPALLKERALKILLESALLTGNGAFTELLIGGRPLDELSEHDILQMYDLKTARYTFCCPLALGAVLAGADELEILRLTEFGRLLGLAFQIEDDLTDLLSRSASPPLSDLKEGKVTILLWYAFCKSGLYGRRVLRNLLRTPALSDDTAALALEVIKSSGALGYAEHLITSLLEKARLIGKSLNMKPDVFSALESYALQSRIPVHQSI